jgi:glycerol kinase
MEPPVSHKHSTILLVLDQGTTSTRAFAFSLPSLAIVASSQRENTTTADDTGLSEQDACELLHASIDSLEDALSRCGTEGDNVATGWGIAGLAIANQRETFVLVDPLSGQPTHNAIVWNDTRSAPMCDVLEHSVGSETSRSITGLPISTYSTATKLAWLMHHDNQLASKLADGSVHVMTIESWLVYKLTNGRSLVTDVSNASRSMLMNIEHLEWSETMCNSIGVSMSCLPATIVSNAENVGVIEQIIDVGKSRPNPTGSIKTPRHRRTTLAGSPIVALIGDQHASLLGHGLQSPPAGSLVSPFAKATYGTGAFVLASTGPEVVHSTNKLLTTVAYKLGRGEQPRYALEGAIASAASALDWCADRLGLAHSAHAVDQFAASKKTSESHDPVFLPAFTGLLSPHWLPRARAALLGMTNATTQADICCSVLEGVAHQIADCVHAIEKDTGCEVMQLLADGGAANAHQMMQMQANVLGKKVSIPRDTEVTARGAAIAAWVALGRCSESDNSPQQVDISFDSDWSENLRQQRRERWQKAITLVAEL